MKLKIFLLILGMSLFPHSALRCDNQDIEQIIAGESKVFSTQSPTRVVIGNPKVADVGDVTDKEIIVNAKGPGVTTLVYWDAFGEQSVKIRVVAEDMFDVKMRVDKLLGKLDLPEVRAEISDEEGKILLLGRVKTSQDRERIISVLGALSSQIIDLIKIQEEEIAVEIDVQIFEVDKDSTKTLGFSWPGSITFTEVGSAGISAAGTSWGKIFKVANVTRGAATPFTLTLDALIQEGKARILSRPRISCQSGREAELTVGGEKPIFTTSNDAVSGNTTSTVEYKEYGINLKVKPTVTEKGSIKVGLNVSVSEVGTAETIEGTAGATTGRAYPLTKRTASTELYVADGQTFAIGGLIKQKTEEDIRRTPFLSDLPIIGGIFRQKVTKEGGGQASRGNTELFISLTPRVVSGERLKENIPEAKNDVQAPAPEAKPIEDSQDPVVRYSEIVKMKILGNLQYPQPAQDASFQGVTKLKLHFSYQGELLDAAVAQTSGFKILDDSALNAAKTTVAYPPFPPGIQEKDLWVEIPIAFRLD